MCAVANGFSSNSQTNLFMSGGQYFQFLTNALCLLLCTTLHRYYNLKNESFAGFSAHNRTVPR